MNSVNHLHKVRIQNQIMLIWFCLQEFKRSFLYIYIYINIKLWDKSNKRLDRNQFSSRREVKNNDNSTPVKPSNCDNKWKDSSVKKSTSGKNTRLELLSHWRKLIELLYCTIQVDYIFLNQHSIDVTFYSVKSRNCRLNDLFM